MLNAAKYDPELLLDGLFHSRRARKLVIALALAGAVVCVAPLLPPIREAVFSFVDAHVSRKGSRGTFEGRFLSLLSLSLVGLAACLMLLCCMFSASVARFFADAKNDTLIVGAALAATALALGFVAVFSYRHGRQWLDSDNASEMILGRLLAEENALVSSSWRYSTEIRLVYQTLFTMPLFKLLGGLGDWALIRAINVLLNNIVLVLSYVFMMNELKVQKKWIFWTAPVLLMPVSTGYWDIVTFGGYYVFFIAQLFCCLGLFFRLCKKTEKAPVVAFSLFTLSSLLLGVQGVRALLCVQVPLFLTGLSFTVSASAPASAQKKKLPLALGASGLAACLAGFAVNYLLHFKYSFSSFENMLLENLPLRFLPKLGECLVSLAGFFGLHTGSALLSAGGFFSVLAIAGTVALFLSAYRRAAAPVPADGGGAGKHGLLRFFVLAALFNVCVFIAVDERVTGKYFILFMVLYVPALPILFDSFLKDAQSGRCVKRVALVAAVALFILGQSYLNFQDLEKRDVNASRAGYIAYLLENKLDYGFALFWNAAVTTELSDGRIDVAGLHTEALDPAQKNFRLHGWLNPEKYYDQTYNGGRPSFLLLSRGEWDAAQAAGRPFASRAPDYEDGDYIVVRYPSASIVYTEALDQ